MDLNQLTRAIMEEATGESDHTEELPRNLLRNFISFYHQAYRVAVWSSRHNKKNPAAVALGKLGGKKGGPARAKKLSREQRKAIAEEAARARWRRRSG